MKTRIVAFSGSMGAGKTLATEILFGLLTEIKGRTYQPKVLKFAQPLYDMQDFIYTRVHKDPPATKDRRLLQFLGTEWGRSIDPNLWIDLWRKDARLHLFKFEDNIILNDDLRFDNEAEQVKAMKGTIIKVHADAEVRGQRIPLVNTGHASENGIDEKYIDLNVYNNGTITELRQNLRYLLNEGIL